MLWIDAYGRVWETQMTRYGWRVARILNGCNGSGPWTRIDVKQMEQLEFFRVP